MTGARWRSALTAAIFALHPIHVESVAWISERKDVLSTFFFILTMLCYHWYIQGPRISKYLLVVVTFTLGLMAKPMLVTLPFVLLLLDMWPLKRKELILPSFAGGSNARQAWWPIKYQHSVPWLILEKVPLMIIALSVCWETFFAQSISGAVSSLERLHFAYRMQNTITSYVTYLWKMIWPLNLAIFYPYPKHFNTALVALYFLFLICVTMIVIKFLRKFPYLVTGWFWYLGTLIPVIGIVQVGSQSMADRYTYIPSIGIFIIASWGLTDIFRRWNYGGRVALSILSAGVLGFLSYSTYIQISTWKNSETLYSHALGVTSDNYLAYNNLGVALYNRGDVDSAIRHYQESLKIKLNYINAHCNLGIALTKEKKYTEAFIHYRECLRIEPGYSEAYYNMGVAFSEMGRKDEAIKQYLEALKNNSNHENAHNNLGLLLAEKGNLNEAIQHYLKALRVNPDNTRTRINLTDALLKKGRFDEALSQVDEAIKSSPRNPNLYTKRAEVSRAKRKGAVLFLMRSIEKRVLHKEEPIL
jgi:tetratricopeptide (TPR) repeat protein